MTAGPPIAGVKERQMHTMYVKRYSGTFPKGKEYQIKPDRGQTKIARKIKTAGTLKSKTRTDSIV